MKYIACALFRATEQLKDITVAKNKYVKMGFFLTKIGEPGISDARFSYFCGY